MPETKSKETKAVTANLDRVKETKNTIRYKELTEGKPPAIGTLYVQKWVLKGTPKKVKMTLEIEQE